MKRVEPGIVLGTALKPFIRFTATFGHEVIIRNQSGETQTKMLHHLSPTIIQFRRRDEILHVYAVEKVGHTLFL